MFHELVPTTFRINEVEMRYRVKQHPRTALLNLYNNMMIGSKLCLTIA